MSPACWIHAIPYTAFELPVEKLGAEETASLLAFPSPLCTKQLFAFREKPGKPILAEFGNQELNLKAVAVVFE